MIVVILILPNISYLLKHLLVGQEESIYKDTMTSSFHSFHVLKKSINA